ncbi:MAG TPA: CoA transferase, partial [Ottowia sp.]|nr:CoA transferase [Ottowia sp.]
WAARFEAAGVPCAPIHSVPEALAHPQVQALGILAPLPGEDFALTALPFSIDGARPLPRSAAPRLGADNAAHGLPPATVTPFTQNPQETP